ncbi:PEP/pyruvate-binding domain-containing protein [Desulfopila aestuarii]|uniref:Pyruvate phosphate dikinase, PEP/pyruvate binding domain n=1 Tax=Desulfopila aestuarii DSM 18488 TaxID=1121416 RepID=A0A1M7XZB4_9BACT|nr:PEP/pyruvate-binding domain-containing protein [Desulfopila aestuarii]SHO44531.1 Pyruvate phosphate dikinase, PEP/pyruvate binding domain [Desulfopila aestuarii DSM 18488]
MFLDSGRVVPDFDPHFKIFHELMQFKVQEILLVSSLYDAFLMEEDGSLATRLINEYHGLNLSKAPRITRVSTAEEALEIIRKVPFDMVLTMPYLGSMDAFELGGEIKKIRPDIQVVLLAHNLRSTFVEKVDAYGVDRVFLWCCEADLLLAIIKNVEDHRNVDADIARAMVRVIIYVEDSPVYRSIFLPLIYREVVRQTQSVLDESLNERHRLLRMRARPKILMATNYEEAMRLYERYRPYVFAVISDARFRKDGELDADAGFSFLEHIRNEIHDLPLLMVSSEPENKTRAEKVPAIFIDKNSPVIRDELHAFFLNYLGFGDFVFRMPDETAIGHASNLLEFEEKLRVIPDESLEYHAKRNHFSNWVMARAEVALARRLHNEYIADIASIADMRDDLVYKVHSLRKLRQQGVVVKFKQSGYDPDVMDFVKIGSGSMGGKARGQAFMWACLQSIHDKESILTRFPVTIPKTCVITADGFDAFVAENSLAYQAKMADEMVADLFLDATLPAWLRKELSAYLKKTEGPLSVRSSSLLEDAQFRPYAGLYSTYFLANNHPDFHERLSQLESAVKLVYASTWFESPRAFSQSSNVGRDDSMAVIIQQVVGRDHGGSWYPAISGVAQSHNYYPVLGMRAEEGIAHIALGIGKTVVEGEKSLRFSPAHPKRLLQFSSVDDMLVNCQRHFYALDMRQNTCLQRYSSNLVRRSVQDAAAELPVQMLSSTYIADEDRIRDADLPGLKVLTFAQLLKYTSYPLAKIVHELLVLGRAGMGGEVEIEFAVTLHPEIEKSTFYFLQIRPMVTGGERVEVQICDGDLEKAFCYSQNSLGHGNFSDIFDIVYVDPDNFTSSKTRQIATEIGVVNRRLAAEKRPYLLIGPGRWGSADPWLGIPVQWIDISGVAAIIELRGRLLKVDPSQGSHFFQNITSLGIPYLTITENQEEGILRTRGQEFLDWSWLSAQPHVQGANLHYVRHVHFTEPLHMKCDGKRSEGCGLPGERADGPHCTVEGKRMYNG